jgi:16S rRNA (cytosine1402-N4)-methyltransferase
MMAGSDGLLSLADWPVTFPCSRAPALELLNVRDGGIYIDGTFGAAAIRARSSPPPMHDVIGIDRDQSAVANGAALVQSADGR